MASLVSLTHDTGRKAFMASCACYWPTSTVPLLLSLSSQTVPSVQYGIGIGLKCPSLSYFALKNV